MAPTTSTRDQPLKINDDMDLVRSILEHVRDAYTEYSLAELAMNETDYVPHERRQARRTQLQLPVTLMPADWSSDDDDAVVVCGDEQVGVTRDISPTGMGIIHDQLLGSDAAIVQLDLPNEGPVRLLLDLRWSVRKSRFSFTSGGRVVGVIGDVP